MRFTYLRHFTDRKISLERCGTGTMWGTMSRISSYQRWVKPRIISVTIDYPIGTRGFCPRISFVIRQPCVVQLEAMTAIASVYTPDGFVIGADGRRVTPDRMVESDNTRKIFGYSAANIKAVGAWSGSLTFEGTNSTFDVKTQTLEIAEHCKNKSSQPCLSMLAQSHLIFIAASTSGWNIGGRYPSQPHRGGPDDTLGICFRFAPGRSDLSQG